MTQVAVVLSGCGHLDGTEIREAVLTLLYLDQQGASVSLFAPNMAQRDVVNHLNGQPMVDSRNVLVEAARIARGQIKPLAEAKAENFDALILPGGFGAAKNLSDIAIKGKDAAVLPELAALLRDFAGQKKPIGAICIAPAVVAAALGKSHHPVVTVGDDEGVETVIASFGGTPKKCATDAITIDDGNQIVTCSAYMRNDPLAGIARGIESLVTETIKRAEIRKQQAA